MYVSDQSDRRRPLWSGVYSIHTSIVTVYFVYKFGRNRRMSTFVY